MCNLTMKKTPISPHIGRDVRIFDQISKAYMLVTDTHIYVGPYSFYNYAKPGAVLVHESGSWYSFVKRRKGKDIWRKQIVRPIPPLIKALSLIYL